MVASPQGIVVLETVLQTAAGKGATHARVVSICSFVPQTCLYGKPVEKRMLVQSLVSILQVPRRNLQGQNSGVYVVTEILFSTPQYVTNALSTISGNNTWSNSLTTSLVQNAASIFGGATIPSFFVTVAGSPHIAPNADPAIIPVNLYVGLGTGALGLLMICSCALWLFIRQSRKVNKVEVDNSVSQTVVLEQHSQHDGQYYKPNINAPAPPRMAWVE